MSFGDLAVANRADGRIWSRDTVLSTTLGRKYLMLIGADWVDSVSGRSLEVFDPATGDLTARAPAGDRIDVDRAVAATRSSFDSGIWTGLSGRECGRIFGRVADLIEQNDAELASLEILNNGTPIQLQLASVDYAASVFRYFAGWCDKISGSTIDLSAGDAQFHVHVTKEPIGIVGLIVPWNGPLGSGQVCVAGSRVYVARQIYDEFVVTMAEFTRALTIGSGFDPTAVIGPLISEKQRQRVQGFVGGAVAEKALTIVGGTAATGSRYFHSPTILAEVRPDSRILREEILGPVITVIPFDDLEAAIISANDTQYRLAAAV